MKKAAFICSLVLVSITPVLFVIGLFTYPFLWSNSTLSYTYNLTFALCLTAKTPINIIWYLLIDVLLLALIITSIFISHFKNRNIYRLPVIICLLDIILNAVMGNWISVILDILLIIAINTSKKDLEY